MQGFRLSPAWAQSMDRRPHLHAGRHHGAALARESPFLAGCLDPCLCPYSNLDVFALYFTQFTANGTKCSARNTTAKMAVQDLPRKRRLFALTQSGAARAETSRLGADGRTSGMKERQTGKGIYSQSECLG